MRSTRRGGALPSPLAVAKASTAVPDPRREDVRMRRRWHSWLSGGALLTAALALVTLLFRQGDGGLSRPVPPSVSGGTAPSPHTDDPREANVLDDNRESDATVQNPAPTPFDESMVERVEPIASSAPASGSSGSVRARRESPPRSLPKPAGPEAGESLHGYVTRLLNEILRLEGDPTRSGDRARMEVELEAYANENPAVVDELISGIQSQTTRHAQKVGLILLGRVASRHAVDFLLDLASGSPSVRAVGDAQDRVQADDMTLTVSHGELPEIAVQSLLQGAGKTGARLPPMGNPDQVTCSATTLEDPYVLRRLVELLGDERTPRSARMAILGGMTRNLPDPSLGGVGDYPRPIAMSQEAERALSTVLALAATGSDGELRTKATRTLGSVRRAGLAREMLDMLLKQPTGDVRNTGWEAIGWAASDPGVRSTILDQISSHPDPGVRKGIILGLGPKLLDQDPMMREAVVRAMESDSSWSIRLEAASVLFRSIDEQSIGRTLEALERSSLERVPAQYRPVLRIELQRAVSRPGRSPVQKERLGRILQRLGE